VKSTPLFDELPYEQQFEAEILDVQNDLVALDRTLFYPTGGGQPGDIGLLASDTAVVRVVETFRDPQNRALIWHRVSSPWKNDRKTIRGTINWELRFQNMAMHSCLHLLCSLIDAPVTGCGMSNGKGRLDFDLPEMNTTKDEITQRLNKLINDAIEIKTSFVNGSNYESLRGLIRNRYALPPETAEAIKVIDVQGVDIQPCGGTHVRNTSEKPQVV
jgi:misacylated tRNA(Ala) deacylase